jgi:two-component system phosphate regulon sensor histidine kinase PhoR
MYDLHEESVQHIVDDAIAAFPPVRYDAVIFKVEVASDVPQVLADRHALVDALVNLLSNAHKYGGTPPQIALSATTSTKGDVILEVRDNGSGIPLPEQRRIFEKFYRIDDRLSRVREGSGLGLAIVKHVVRAHNGRIAVESGKGKGSTFRITLPPLDPARQKSKVALKLEASQPS